MQGKKKRAPTFKEFQHRNKLRVSKIWWNDYFCLYGQFAYGWSFFFSLLHETAGWNSFLSRLFRILRECGYNDEWNVRIIVSWTLGWMTSLTEEKRCLEHVWSILEKLNGRRLYLTLMREIRHKTKRNLLN